MVPRRDVQAAADRLGAVLADPVAWTGMIDAAEAHVRRTFDVEATTLGLVERWRELLSEKGRGWCGARGDDQRPLPSR